MAQQTREVEQKVAQVDQKIAQVARIYTTVDTAMKDLVQRMINLETTMGDIRVQMDTNTNNTLEGMREVLGRLVTLENVQQTL